MSIRTTQHVNEVWVGEPGTGIVVTQHVNEIWMQTSAFPPPPVTPPPPVAGPSGASGDSTCSCEPPTFIQLTTVP
jgi:hypothetical protein